MIIGTNLTSIVCFVTVPSVCLSHDGHHLESAPDRHGHDAADLELIDQRLGNAFGRGRDHDLVEGRGVRPSGVAIAFARMDVRVPQPFQQRAGTRGQRGNDFDRVHLVHQLREHGGLVSGSGADFKHAIRFCGLNRLCHVGDDVWLRDGLATADRQGTVFIRAMTQMLRNELVARHPPHRLEHGRISDVPAAELGFNHLSPRGGIVS